MGVIQNIIQRFREQKEAEAELDDSETRDKYLRSLRRERRVQLEVLEKEKLKQAITEFNKKRSRQYLWGVKDKLEKKETLIKEIKKKQAKLLRDTRPLLKQRSMLNNQEDEFEEKKSSWLKKHDL